jgi:hypothetical protein
MSPVKIHKLTEVVTRKLATACRQLEFADSVRVLHDGHTIELETKDLDTVRIDIRTLKTFIEIDNVKDVEPTITKKGVMYVAYRGFTNGSLAKSEIKDYMIELKRQSHDVLAVKYDTGVVVYRKTRYQ